MLHRSSSPLNLIRSPGWCRLTPGAKEQWGSKTTKWSPDTKEGVSVRWYVLLKPRPNRPVLASFSSFEP
jgi:hypothetical protein